jgi:hypothetical protein
MNMRVLSSSDYKAFTKCLGPMHFEHFNIIGPFNVYELNFNYAM